MKRRLGLSLLELVFAIAVLVMVFFALMSLFPTMIFSIHQSEHRMQANSLGQLVLDQCNAGPFSNLVPGVYSASAPGPLGPILNNVTLTDQTVLVPQVTIQSGPSATTANLLRCVTVNVTWTERSRDLVLTRYRQISNLSR